ncbi:MAG: ArsR family transcriptional regulator [Alphaproteobacteria bacterium]|nr:ArsR family transcriptional regulator [Alphaproteobacteria bacterium]
MDIQKAIIVFDALSQETRLRVFRLLVEHGTQGAPAGKLSEALDVPHNTLSFHLNHMSNAGLVASKREGRSIIYTANFDLMRDLIGFLVKDCCSVEFASIRKDKKSGCSIIELADCCPPKEKKA